MGQPHRSVPVREQLGLGMALREARSTRLREMHMQSGREEETEMTIEWQGFGNSDTVHLIDTERNSTKRSGRRAFCGRYPGATFVNPWWSLPVPEVTQVSLSTYGLKKCIGCENELDASLINPVASR